MWHEDFLQGVCFFCLAKSLPQGDLVQCGEFLFCKLNRICLSHLKLFIVQSHLISFWLLYLLYLFYLFVFVFFIFLSLSLFLITSHCLLFDHISYLFGFFTRNLSSPATLGLKILRILRSKSVRTRLPRSYLSRVYVSGMFLI